MAKNENNPIPAIKPIAQDRREKQGIFADKYNPKSKGYGIVYLLTILFARPGKDRYDGTGGHRQKDERTLYYWSSSSV